MRVLSREVWTNTIQLTMVISARKAVSGQNQGPRALIRMRQRIISKPTPTSQPQKCLGLEPKDATFICNVKLQIQSVRSAMELPKIKSDTF